MVSTTYTGLNGTHVWRQSDAFAQILSLYGHKGMAPLQLFNQSAKMFDTPVYEWLAAELARLTGSDPLVSARLINDLFWGVFLVGGFRIADRLTRGAGLVFVLLAATSPVFLQYFSAPIPDGMALTLSVLAVDLLMGRLRAVDLAAASLLLIVAALIKSPIPFVLLVFLGVRIIVTRSVGGELLSIRRFARVCVPFTAAAVAAVAAELIGKVVSKSTAADEAANLAWYFGTSVTRTQQYFWQTMLDRTTASLASPVLVAVVAIALVLLFACEPVEFLRQVVPQAVGFFAGWLVFSNVFLLHDYYEMGVAALVMLGGAASVARLGRIALAGRGAEVERWAIA